MSEEKPDETIGIELQEEPSGGTLEPSDELAEALRAAEQAVDARQAAREGTGGSPEGGAGSAANSADKVMLEALSEELQSLKAMYEEEKERRTRLQAEFENFRRRGLKERQELLQYGHQNLVKDLLVTVDNLDRAIEHAEQSDGGDLGGLLQGVDLVRKSLLDTLGKHGVEAIEAEGQPFDPAVHEAMAQVAHESLPANSVVQVFEKGYQLKERMLRPARVTVSKAASKQEGSQ